MDQTEQIAIGTWCRALLSSLRYLTRTSYDFNTNDGGQVVNLFNTNNGGPTVNLFNTNARLFVIVQNIWVRRGACGLMSFVILTTWVPSGGCGILSFVIITTWVPSGGCGILFFVIVHKI